MKKETGLRNQYFSTFVVNLIIPMKKISLIIATIAMFASVAHAENSPAPAKNAQVKDATVNAAVKADKKAEEVSSKKEEMNETPKTHHRKSKKAKKAKKAEAAEKASEAQVAPATTPVVPATK